MALLSQKYQKKKKSKCLNGCSCSWQEVVTQILPITVPNGIWEYAQNLPKDLFIKHNTLTHYLIWSNNQQTLTVDLQQWGREEKVKKKKMKVKDKKRKKKGKIKKRKEENNKEKREETCYQI